MTDPKLPSLQGTPFALQALVPVHVGCTTVNLYAIIDLDMHVEERAHAFQINKTALAAQEGARKQQLQDVQRLWIKYRDANCGFAGSATGGTIDQVNGTGCVLDMTQTRAQELEDLVGP